jgi:hypothetical protein
MVCMQSILQGWLRLTFLTGFVMYESPELVFALLMGPDLYDVYLAMMLLTAVTFVITEMAPRWYNPWWVKRKTRKLCMNLSRMRHLMLLIEYWNADKWKGTHTAFKGGQSGPNRNTSYCPRFYTRTKGGAKVKNKGAGIPCPRTTVCEVARRQATHEGEPTSSERVIATGYDPGNDDSTKPTVYTVVCNLNTSLLANGASSVRKFFRPDTGSYLVGMDNHASCCMSPYLEMFVSLEPCPGAFVRGVKGKIPVTGKGTMSLRLQSDKGNITEELIPESLYISELEMVLMCPQHWSQVANDHFPEQHGTWSYQQGEEFFMEWRQRTLRKTIPWDKRTNTTRFYTAPDTGRYRAFAERFDVKNRTSDK